MKHVPLYRTLAALSLSFTVSAPVLACDICSVFVAERAQGITSAGFQAGLAEQFTHFGSIKADGAAVSNDAGQFLNSSNTQLYLNYPFTHALGAQVNIPIIYRSYSRTGTAGSDTGSVSGVGDISALARYLLLEEVSENSTFHWSALSGIKLPTGSSARLAEEMSEGPPPPGVPDSVVHGHDLTLGSGSFDFLVGMTAQYNVGRFTIPATLQYAIRTQGSYGYQFANDFTFQLSSGYFAVLQHSFSLVTAMGLLGESKGKDVFQGSPADDTGITAIYVGPQLSFTAGERVSGLLALDLPWVMNTTSTQIVPDSRIRAVVTGRF